LLPDEACVMLLLVLEINFKLKVTLNYYEHYTPFESNLTNYSSLWEDSQTSNQCLNYTFTITFDYCDYLDTECDSCLQTTRTIVVANDTVMSIEYANASDQILCGNDTFQNFSTVSALLDTIQTILDAPVMPDFLTVSYDDGLGYPYYFNLDNSIFEFNDTVSWNISSFSCSHGTSHPISKYHWAKPHYHKKKTS